jgi:Cu+-exporting ATPase
MDVLVSLGTTASYGYACWGLWKGDTENTHFFETSATLICFVLAGKWMQALAVRRTSKALSELMKLQSSTAIRISPTSSSAQSDGFNPLHDSYQEETVPICNVQKGDLVKVIRGSSLPADGRIKFGEMSVDESMVTGESMPVLKTPGSDVLGGTICVETGSEGSGAVFVEVTGVGSDTALAQIIQLVQDAQTRAVPIQSFADSVSAVFVPSVCIVSLLTYMTWYALCESQVIPPEWYENLQESPTTFSLTFAIACLVISCPCALGLATPTAVIVGSGKGAQLGVLMKGGEALEVASKVTSVIFDKTGTLTKGQPVIVDCQQIDKSVDSKDLLWMLGSLEKNSEHPLARAVVTYAEEKLGDYLEQKPFAQPKAFQALTGRGAEGVLNDSVIAVGSRLFTTEAGIHIPIDVENYMQLLEREGKTAVLVTVDGNVCLVMGIADRLKSDAIASVSFLRDIMKLDVWMVTGDTRATANAIGRQLGLPEHRIISEALPAAKVQQVRKLQGEDHIVAMVGDGINDSPALAQADVGISLGSGAKIATEASDMVLVRGNVTEVCTALHLSRRIFQRIQLNLLFSLVYNCLGIPIASGVFYPFYQQRLPPTIAGAAMALSSVSVVLSSLSLRLYRSPSVYRRRSPVTAWSREIERQRDDELHETLLANDYLGQSDLTDATAVVDNRSMQNLSSEEIV